METLSNITYYTVLAIIAVFTVLLIGVTVYAVTLLSGIELIAVVVFLTLVLMSAYTIITD
jgi:hypothetical protein